MHKTNAHWEAGARPSRDLVERVGTMMGELQQAGVLLDGAGLRPTSEGARIRFSNSARTVAYGPFGGDKELLAGFTVVRTPSLDDAIDAATRQATELGLAEVDVRPVTEPWDIGLTDKPANIGTRRYMILHKATTESEVDQTPESQAARLVHAVESAAVTHVATMTMRPSSRGRRYKNSERGITYFDGPFTESKEMIGGYITVSADSLDQVDPVVRRYITTVGAEEVDVRELG
jgi:hypothetical protein